MEYRDIYSPNLLQISYGYIAYNNCNLVGPSYTESEIENGFRLKWVTIGEAIKLLENDYTMDKIGQYIKIRDLEFLKEAKQRLKEYNYDY